MHEQAVLQSMHVFVLAVGELCKVGRLVLRQCIEWGFSYTGLAG